MKQTTDRTRRKLHDLVADRVADGEDRSAAMFAVAEAEGVRPGIAATAFWIIERERQPAMASPAPFGPSQLVLDLPEWVALEAGHHKPASRRRRR